MFQTYTYIDILGSEWSVRAYSEFHAYQGVRDIMAITMGIDKAITSLTNGFGKWEITP